MVYGPQSSVRIANRGPSSVQKKTLNRSGVTRPNGSALDHLRRGYWPSAIVSRRIVACLLWRVSTMAWIALLASSLRASPKADGGF